MSLKGKANAKKGGGSKGNPFDRMMKEQCNKPVAAKSAGIVGKWGVTSFTSIRTGDQPQPAPGVPRAKKFFKSRTQEKNDSSETPSSAEPLPTVSSVASSQTTKKIFRAKLPETRGDLEEEDGPYQPQPRHRPRRPAQRTDAQARSPMHVARSPRPVSRSPLQVRSPLQETSSRKSPRSPQPANRPPKKPKPRSLSPLQHPPTPSLQLSPLPISQSSDSQPTEQSQISQSSNLSSSKSEQTSESQLCESSDSIKSKKRMKRKHDDDEQMSPSSTISPSLASPNNPPLKLKLSLTKSPAKGGITEFSVVGGEKGKEVNKESPNIPQPPAKKRGRPPGVPSPIPPMPSSPLPSVQNKIKNISPEEKVDSPNDPSPLPTIKKKVKKGPPEDHVKPISPLPNVKKKIKKEIKEETIEVSHEPLNPPPTDKKKVKTIPSSTIKGQDEECKKTDSTEVTQPPVKRRGRPPGVPSPVPPRSPSPLPTLNRKKNKAVPSGEKTPVPNHQSPLLVDQNSVKKISLQIDKTEVSTPPISSEKQPDTEPTKRRARKTGLPSNDLANIETPISTKPVNIESTPIERPPDTTSRSPSPINRRKARKAPLKQPPIESNREQSPLNKLEGPLAKKLKKITPSEEPPRVPSPVNPDPNITDRSSSPLANTKRKYTKKAKDLPIEVPVTSNQKQRSSSPSVRPQSPLYKSPDISKKKQKNNPPKEPHRAPSPPRSLSPLPVMKKKPKKVQDLTQDEVQPKPGRTNNSEQEAMRKPLSPVQRPPSPELEINFPARITRREVVKPSISGKKSIFKSRSKPDPPAADIVAVPDPIPEKVLPTGFIEEPRVPLIASSFDLFKAWDKEIPSLGPQSPSSDSFIEDLEHPSSSPKVQKLASVPEEVTENSKPRPQKTFFKNRTKKEEKPKEIEKKRLPEDHPGEKISKGRHDGVTKRVGEELESRKKDAPRVEAPKKFPNVAHKPVRCASSPGSPDYKINFPTRIQGPPPGSVASSRMIGQKRSIFKSKSKENTAPPKKALSLYKHKMGWGGDQRESIKTSDETKSSQPSSAEINSYDDSEFDDGPSQNTQESDLSFAPSRLTRVATYPTNNTGIDDDGELVTQVKCPKSYKEYFTVIKNVKKAHEMNDLGEYQEFADDVEYISDGMKARNSTAARCLAAVSLAQKCMKPSFRMHLRAHGEVSKFFVELKDAPSNPSLALCTSTILFVLSQDRLNMDMDRDSLELMLNLLDTDCSIKTALEGKGELAKNKQKVIDICTEMKAAGHAGSLNIDLLSADHLAMETLLSMTSKRAGEWFKEELRELGGLGHLARTLSDCVSYLTVKPITSWTEALTDKLKKGNRILRVLENISHENEENCNYLITYGREENNEFIDILQNFFKLLDEEVQLNPTTDMADKEEVGSILRDTLFSLVRVHINIVHDYRPKAFGSLHVGQKQGCVGRALRCLFIMPYWFCPLSKRFEALVLALTLFINMVEHCEENRQSLMDSMAAQKELDSLCVKEEPRMAIEDLVQLFVDRDTLAKMSEEKTDNILDCVEEEVQEIDPREEGKDKDKPTLDDTVQKLIGKAGNHMESTLIAAYVGLIIGYLVQNSEDYEQRIREYLPSRDFKAVVIVLNKMYNFMKMTALGTVSSSKGLKATEKIIKYLEKIDAEPEELEEEEDNVDFTLFNVSTDDSTLLDSGPNIDQTSYSFDDWGKL